MPFRARVAALAAIAVGLLALPAHSEAHLPADFWGVDSVNDPSGGEFDFMHQTGIQVYRMSMSWRQIEPQRPTDTGYGEIHNYNWSVPDSLLSRAAQTGVDVQATLIDTPAWLAQDGRTTPVSTDESTREWRAFARAVVQRYGPSGTFWTLHPGLPKRPPVAYQIWNEMNTGARYLPKPDPKEYAKVLTTAGAQIRQLDPQAEILPGGMFGTPQNEDSYSAWTFMRKLLFQKGVAKYVDAVGVHPYSPDLRGIRYQMDKMRRVLDSYHLQKVPIDVTELGWSSGVHKDRFFFFKGPRGQKLMLKRSYRLLLKGRKRWNVHRIIWFSWRDVDQVPKGCTYCKKFGLLRDDLSKKGSYDVYRRYAKGEIQVKPTMKPIGHNRHKRHKHH